MEEYGKLKRVESVGKEEGEAWLTVFPLVAAMSSMACEAPFSSNDSLIFHFM